MSFIFGIIFTFLAIFAKKLFKLWINPTTIFLFLWGIILSFYSLHLYNINEVSPTIINIYIFGIFSFFLGTLTQPIHNRTFKKNLNSNNFSFQIDKTKNVLFFCALIISLTTLVIFTTHMIPYWLTGGAGAVKSAQILGWYSASPILDVTFQMIAKPIGTVAILVAPIYLLMANKKQSFLFLPIVFLILVFTYLSTGNKMILMLPIITFIFTILYKNKSGLNNKFTTIGLYSTKKISKSKKLFLTLISVTIIVLLIYLLSIKSEGNPFKSFYFYLVGCVPFSEYALETIDKWGDYTHGVTSFNGILRGINYVYRFVFGSVAPYSNDMEEAYSNMAHFEEGIEIAPGVMFNSWYTFFMSFYRDAGIWGVVILSFIYGIFNAFCYKKLIKCNNTFYLMLFLLNTYHILTSMYWFSMFIVYDVMTYVYLIVFFYFPSSSKKSFYRLSQTKTYVINTETAGNGYSERYTKFKNKSIL